MNVASESGEGVLHECIKGRITKTVNIKAESECSCYFGEGSKRGDPASLQGVYE